MMVVEKESIKMKMIGTKTGNILLLVCVLASICMCILVPLLLVRNNNQETPRDDVTLLLQLEEIFPDSDIVETCEILDFLLTREVTLETQPNTNPRIRSRVLKDTLNDLKAKHCVESPQSTNQPQPTNQPQTTNQPQPTNQPMVCNASARYRTIDGSCNNLRYPNRGMASRAQRRYLPPVYKNGLDSPRLYSVDGTLLPSPRNISNAVFKAGDIQHNSTLTVMHMSFGQFFDHDLVFTPVHKDQNGRDIDCCLDNNKHKPECIMRMTIPENDPFFAHDCMKFVRSLPAMTESLENTRDQLNTVTSYIDASNVYGSDKKKSDTLRTFTKGRLLVDEHNRLPPGPTKCFHDKVEDYCQNAGDIRVNVVPNLSAMHLLFVREHNRIAEQFALLSPSSDDNNLFYKTRKIIIAIMQHIVYNEYLPSILNTTYMNAYDLNLHNSGWSTAYNENYDATLANVFGVAAFRFGHSQITNIQAQFSESHTKAKEIVIEETFHRPHFCEQNNGAGCEGVLRWMSNDIATVADRFFETGVRDKLFPDVNNKTLDLPAININRGRDHGIPPYNAWRKWCNLTEAKTFQAAVIGGLKDHSADALKKVYSHPDDIDLFAGAMSETHIPDGAVGPTFACILGFQFKQLKNGDRFWYEINNDYTGITLEQLQEIRKIKLSNIICSNIPITEIQKFVFHEVSDSFYHKPQETEVTPFTG